MTLPSSTCWPVPVERALFEEGVSDGKQHSLALGSDGKTYAWGTDVDGELGDGNIGGATPTPVEVNLPSGVTFTAVSAGMGQSLALGSDGKTYAWGTNESGQLGIGTYGYSSATPVEVIAPSGVTFTAVAAGAASSLALGSDGKAYAWGFNGTGQLGNGSTGGQSATPTAVSLTGPAPALQFTVISTGGFSSLALSIP